MLMALGSETLAGHLRTSARLPGDVAARPSEAFDEAGSDRIARACHHDRPGSRRRLRVEFC
jgi:hypothetical protein